jgi:hypothetical protein
MGLLLTVPVYCFAAASDARDGNWWLEQNKITKLSFMAGFLDGIHLGKNFSMWGFMDDPQSEACLKKVVLSNTEFENKYLSKVKVGQLVDGLDVFYSDYKNRSISPNNAVWLVLNEIAGTPKEKLDKMVEAYRRNPRI